MSLIEISPNAPKEDRLNRILDYMKELKTSLAETMQAFENDGAEEETLDFLTGALDALEDAYDGILDVTEDLGG